MPSRTATSLRAPLLAGLALILLPAAVLPATAANPESLALMSPTWAALTCEAWNESSTLTGGLDNWIQNDLERGYKLLRLYRTDCDAELSVELRISEVDGEARCTYGGAVGAEELDSDADYLMHATTERWLEMGAGEYGPMRAMMFGRLKFQGPRWEAMKNMGPFASFLTLVGAVDSDSTVCPVEQAEPPTPTVTELLPNAVEPMAGVLAGGQPTDEALAAARAAGYKTVINLRAEGEPGAGRQEVEAHGMSFVSLPIAGSEGLTRSNAEAFAEALAAAELPAIVHCGSGNRVGAMFALRAFYVDGKSTDEALEIGLASGLTSLEGAVRSALDAGGQ